MYKRTKEESKWAFSEHAAQTEQDGGETADISASHYKRYVWLVQQ